MDSSDWWCRRCGQHFRPADVPSLIPTENGNRFVHQGDCPVFKIPRAWADELGLPDVGPVWKDYPITKDEFLARQGKWDERGRRLP